MRALLWLPRTFLAMVLLAVSTIVSAIPSIALTDLTDGEPTIVVNGLSFALPCIFLPEALTCSILLGSVPPNTIQAVNSHLSFALTEGPAGPAAILSDMASLTIGVDPTGAFGVELHFNSDAPLASGADNPVDTLVDCTQAGMLCAQETGGVQSFTVFVPGSRAGTSVALFDLSIQSDLDSPPVNVPEPATFALLGLGLAGLRFNRRRKA